MSTPHRRSHNAYKFFNLPMCNQYEAQCVKFSCATLFAGVCTLVRQYACPVGRNNLLGSSSIFTPSGNISYVNENSSLCLTLRRHTFQAVRGIKQLSIHDARPLYLLLHAEEDACFVTSWTFHVTFFCAKLVRELPSAEKWHYRPNVQLHNHIELSWDCFPTVLNCRWFVLYPYATYSHHMCFVQ